MSTARIHALPAQEAYTIWAELYDRETAVSALECIAAEALTPPLAGCALLDAGCGTGRRLPLGADAARLFGVDLATAMLNAGRQGERRRAPVAASDFRMLPIADSVFDTIWCRLAIGHIPDVAPAYREFARVTRPASHVIVTDFHPDAAGAGHSRTFRDPEGRLHAIEHFIHDAEDHECAAEAVGFRLDERLDLTVGAEVREFYERAGALDRYEEQKGLALVLAMRFIRE